MARKSGASLLIQTEGCNSRFSCRIVTDKLNIDGFNWSVERVPANIRLSRGWNNSDLVANGLLIHTKRPKPIRHARAIYLANSKNVLGSLQSNSRKGERPTNAC